MRAEDDMINAPKPENARSQKGSVMVEFALILPFFLLLLFGVVTFSAALYNKTVLTMATREGARAGAKYVAGDDDDDRETRARAAALAACQNEDDQTRLISFGEGGTPNVAADISGDNLTVTASVNYTGLFFNFYDVDFDGLNSITSETTMRLE